MLSEVLGSRYKPKLSRGKNSAPSYGTIVRENVFHFIQAIRNAIFAAARSTTVAHESLLPLRTPSQ